MIMDEEYLFRRENCPEMVGQKDTAHTCEDARNRPLDPRRWLIVADATCRMIGRGRISPECLVEKSSMLLPSVPVAHQHSIED